MASTIDNYWDADAEDYNIELAQVDLQKFEKLSVDDLVTNIYIYNSDKEHFKKCSKCQIYNSFCVAALKGKWEKDWGDVHYFIQRLIQKAHQKYVTQYTTEIKEQILNLIKKYSVKSWSNRFLII